YLKKTFENRGAGSIKICTLLLKDRRDGRTQHVEPDYVGFVCPDEFVVGYGLDYNERYRNLPYIGILKKEIYS
ncbi:MAG: hypoxanthine phosphoribosyltransferase, partial [Firmicutes bacterium]|nr:hypoxanthine phosphoribosyltransferase [Bacillota bacterium]